MTSIYLVATTLKMTTLRRNVALFVSTVWLALMLSVMGGAAHAQILTGEPETPTRAPPPPPVNSNNALFSSQSVPTTMVAGELYNVSVSMRNTGENEWNNANRYRLGSLSPHDNQTWGIGRVDLGVSEFIQYWEIKTFNFQVRAPITPGTYTFHFGMLQEDREWFGTSSPVSVSVVAPAPVHSAQIISTSVPSSMVPGQTYNVAVTMKNTGNTTWTAPSFRLGSQNPENNMIWGLNRIIVSAPVSPGQQHQFVFSVVAPAAGSYAMQWRMLIEDVTWFGPTSSNSITVATPVQKPVISVSGPSALTQNSPFTTVWSTSNATSLTRVCTANGTGYTVSETLALSGSRTQVAQAAWVGYPSTCTWTATGSGGSTTYTHVLTTSTGSTTPAPLITVQRSPAPMTAGAAFTLTWSSTNATTVSRVCTASGTGFTSNAAMPTVSGTQTGTASAAWVGYPSTCTWTATGSGGTAKYVETMTTVAAGAGGVTYIHTDGLGSPVVRTDASRKVVRTTRYEPYGYVASGVTPTIGFTGHVNDSDTGLTYMQQRYYDPVAGRFLSIDPVVTDANTASSFNRYNYANNSPYKYVDPDGRNALTKLIKQTIKHDGNVVKAAGDVISDVVTVVSPSSTPVDRLEAAISLVSPVDVSDAKAVKNFIGKLPKPGKGRGSVAPADRDPKRNFSDKDRDAKRQEQDNKCGNGCGKDIDKNNSDGHHIERHADGGRTVSENHAEVCKDCHRELHK